MTKFIAKVVFGAIAFNIGFNVTNAVYTKVQELTSKK